MKGNNEIFLAAADAPFSACEYYEQFLNSFHISYL